jgi:hypothetical protein
MSTTPSRARSRCAGGGRPYPDEPRSLRIEDWLTVIIMALWP